MATVKSASVVKSIGTNDEFKAQVLDSPVPVVVDFWATWCGPCRAQAPIVDQVADSAGDHARVVKVNVDECPDVADQFDVSKIPTLIVFKDGKESTRFVGVQSADAISRALGLGK